MLALMSHCRAVCRGNLVFFATHRNLSVHRLNTNHSDSLHTSDGALICLHSGATVGLYAGETLFLCYTYKSFSSSTEYKSFGFPAYEPVCADISLSPIPPPPSA